MDDLTFGWIMRPYTWDRELKHIAEMGLTQKMLDQMLYENSAEFCEMASNCPSHIAQLRGAKLKPTLMISPIIGFGPLLAG